MTERQPLLLDEESGEEEQGGERTQDLHNMAVFHGKELSKSFRGLHSQQSSMVRLAVGKEGLFKIESKADKVLCHWPFSDIKDWSFSGYSFTLTLRSGGNYHLRTDDGESVCSFIEAFKKNPEEALELVKATPPNSAIPDIGFYTLKRKFSGNDTRQPSPDSVKFYTLARKKNHRNSVGDPTTRLAQSIEVDSRLRGASVGTTPTDLAKSLPDRTLNGVPVERQQARDLLTQRLGQAQRNETHHSNGFLAGPVSTRGEPTRDAATHSVLENPTKQPSPLLVRRSATPTRHAPPPPMRPPPPAEEEATAAKPTKQGAAPSQLTKTSAAEGVTVKQGPKPRPVPSSAKPLLPRRPGTTKPPGHREDSPSDSDSLASGDMAPLLRRASSGASSGSGPFSPTDDDFQYVPLGGGSKTSVANSSSSDSLYDKLEKIQSDVANIESSVALSESQEGAPPSGKQRPPSYKVVTPPPLDPDAGQERRGSSSSSVGSSDSSAVYDHLSPLHEPRKQTGAASSEPYQPLDLLPAPFDLALKSRSTSQPMFHSTSTPSSARQTPSPSGQSGHLLAPSEEEEEEEEDDDLTPTNSETNVQPGTTAVPGGVGGVRGEVVLRLRKTRVDPFADILSAPRSMLRWSQELNPLYDYIKGIKISDDVKLYDVPSIATVSHEAPPPAPPTKPPSIILEEDSDHESVTSPKEEEAPITIPEKVRRESQEDDNPERIFLVGSSGSTGSLPRRPRQHIYEDVLAEDVSRSQYDLSSEKRRSKGSSGSPPSFSPERSSTLEIPSVRRYRSESRETTHAVSPRLGKRQLALQRRSRSLGAGMALDDSVTEAVKKKQRPMRVGDNMKDFSYVMREYRLFYVKMPNRKLHNVVFSINKPVSELRESLCGLLGVDNADSYLLYVEGAVLTTQKESDSVADVPINKVNRAGSLTHLSDSQSLPDQGSQPVLLKPSLSLRMQSVTTSRILSLMCDDEVSSSVSYPSELPADTESEFHKCWISIVQGNLPCSQDDAIRLAALQYQAYFLDRTAVHSVVGFCRPTDFLPGEFAGVRGIEQKMYKEQERLKLRSHADIMAAYVQHCSRLPLFDAVLFPAREPRKKLLQSTKLKPILLGVSSHAVMRIDIKTKEVLDEWDYQMLRNWAYSRRTFVLAFSNKNFPVECNQAKWITELVDFHVDSILNVEGVPSRHSSVSPEQSPEK